MQRWLVVASLSVRGTHPTPIAGIATNKKPTSDSFLRVIYVDVSLLI